MVEYAKTPLLLLSFSIEALNISPGPSTFRLTPILTIVIVALIISELSAYL